MRYPVLTHLRPYGHVLDYVKVLALLAVVTSVCWFMPVSNAALGYVYLLAVIALSLNLSRWPALAAAVMSGAAWDFFFLPPKLSFAGIHFDEGLLLTTYFAVALIGSQLTALRFDAQRSHLLMESERMHQTLLDSVSHEMMTPLAVFRSGIEQLNNTEEAKRDRIIVELKVALHRLDGLVTNLLNQNRLESGVLMPKFDWCDCRELVSSARMSVGAQIGDHPFTNAIGHDVPMFRADAALMEQAIGQLILNSALHTPSNTAILATAELTGYPMHINITVADNGPGVPREIAGTIFDKFARGKNARKGGLGLGLSIVRGFMRAQGGDVVLGTNAWGGARFTLSVPYRRKAAIPVS
jgi:K+-sensing histidine kinase KdpD